MYVDLSSGAAVVCQADDLKSLSVVAPGATVNPAALGDLGEADGGHVWLAIASLRESAAASMPEAERDAWTTGFDGMIAYATSKGWTNEAGTHVRAHVEASK